jgi:histone-binding protein RBBP4
METPPSTQGVAVVKKKETRGRKPKPKEDKKEEQQQNVKSPKESKKSQQHQQNQQQQQQQQASVDEKYTQWKSLVPVLYDWLANHNLVWPSLSCRFVFFLSLGFMIF